MSSLAWDCGAGFGLAAAALTLTYVALANINIWEASLPEGADEAKPAEEEAIPKGIEPLSPSSPERVHVGTLPAHVGRASSSASTDDGTGTEVSAGGSLLTRHRHAFEIEAMALGQTELQSQIASLSTTLARTRPRLEALGRKHLKVLSQQDELRCLFRFFRAWKEGRGTAWTALADGSSRTRDPGRGLCCSEPSGPTRGYGGTEAAGVSPWGLHPGA